MAKQKKIVLGVTGSIAAFKAAELVRMMTRNHWDVNVIMTEAATRYVGPLTFQALTMHAVAVGRFDDALEQTYPHIDVGKEADAFVIAPCTANVMAKLAHGLADDILSATVLASQAPLIVAPAMNVNMWKHPATQENVATLKRRGVSVLAVGSGELACGMEGEGRLCDLSHIITAIEAVF